MRLQEMIFSLQHQLTPAVAEDLLRRRQDLPSPEVVIQFFSSFLIELCIFSISNRSIPYNRVS